MISPKKFTVTLLTFLVALSSIAQTVIINKQTERLKSESIEGYAIDLEGINADVSAAFIKYLKTFGKVKQMNDYALLTESAFSGHVSSLPIYILIKQKVKTTQAWLGIKLNDWSVADAEGVNKQLEKLLYDFGVKFYRDQIQIQIDESTQALLAVEKQQQRFVNQNGDINTKLENNKREKAKLEKLIGLNKLEYETLLKKIEKNKHDQDSMVVVNEQVKKIVEMHKEKQRKVN